MGENLSALAISERCHCCGIILKSPKRPRADEGSLLVGCGPWRQAETGQKRSSPLTTNLA
jgi:hypothetical protein